MVPTDSTTDIERLHAKCVKDIDAGLDASFEDLSKHYNWKNVVCLNEDGTEVKQASEPHEIQAEIKRRLRPLLNALLDGWLLELKTVPQDSRWPQSDYSMLKKRAHALLPADGEVIAIRNKSDNGGLWLEDPVYLAGIAVNLVLAQRTPTSVITGPAETMAAPGITSSPSDLPIASAEHSPIAHLRLPSIARKSLAPFLEKTIDALTDKTTFTTTLDDKGRISLRMHASKIKRKLWSSFDSAMRPVPFTMEEFDQRLELSAKKFSEALNTIPGLTDGAKTTIAELYSIHCIVMREAALTHAQNDLRAKSEVT